MEGRLQKQVIKGKVCTVVRQNRHIIIQPEPFATKRCRFRYPRGCLLIRPSCWDVEIVERLEWYRRLFVVAVRWANVLVQWYTHRVRELGRLYGQSNDEHVRYGVCEVRYRRVEKNRIKVSNRPA